MRAVAQMAASVSFDRNSRPSVASALVKRLSISLEKATRLSQVPVLACLLRMLALQCCSLRALTQLCSRKLKRSTVPVYCLPAVNACVEV